MLNTGCILGVLIIQLSKFFIFYDHKKSKNSTFNFFVSISKKSS